MNCEKILARMRGTKSGWGQADFKSLYEGFGFILREGSNHVVYKHAKYPHLRATVARHNSLATGYAKDAVDLIDQLKALEAEENNEPGGND